MNAGGSEPPVPFGTHPEDRLRDATVSDLPDLGHVALRAKRHWQYPEQWIEAWSDSLKLRPEEFAVSRVFVAESRGRLLGFCAIAPAPPSWSLEHMWVLPEFMGRGVGTALFRAACEHVKTRGGVTLSIESDPNAEGFYIRLGARRVGRVPAHMAGTERYLPVFEMDLR